ncbi:MAG: Acyl-[acyl-carrier-protein]--UDP-N-acetylglucosamine O-acyltransferase [Alphaproteobacteria bacterium]|nr:Acyl-[acyl-carrier-protein]--UDP-N-acetylglucosamine O-acyltransferase [Alphaproteobacteria bacterium]MDB5740621.1 Acyl-[acyl-carrier-protein]--UDP-N-acetylglucosamine O-acyltransferase [Alphaproteobacteria bacterium]
MAIHPSAVVEDGAVLGAGAEIGPFCHIGPRVALGDGVRLHSHVSITGVTRLGAGCRVYPGAVLGGDGQIRNNDFADGRLQIGANCVLREMVSMNAGSRKGGGVTTVGARGYFMANSHVGHDCHVGDDVTFANSVALGGHSEIGDGAIFGGLAAVQQFCRVGKGAMVGGLTGVNRDVIPYAMAFGDHVELAGLNLIGLKRRGLSKDTINAMRATFRSVFYGSGGSIADRARAARAQFAGVAEVAEITDFILADSRQELCLARRRGASE